MTATLIPPDFVPYSWRPGPASTAINAAERNLAAWVIDYVDSRERYEGDGELLGGHVTNPPAAHVLDYRDGTLAAPATIGVTASFSRVDGTKRAEVDAMGPTGTDGPDGATVIRSTVKGSAANEVQVVAGFFDAWQTSSYGGNGNDACAIYGSARSTGTGRAITAYFDSKREGAASRGQQAFEVRIINESGSDDAYAPGSFSKSMGIEFNAQGANRAGTVIEVGHGFGQAFDTALAFHLGSVATAVYRDDSEAERSIFITAPHAKGAIVVKSGAGAVVLGREEPTSGTHLLELFAAEGQTLDPIMKIGGTQAGVNVSVEYHNASGQMKTFMAAGAKAFLPQTASGDSGILFTPGKTWHLGAVAANSIFKASDASLAFFGATLATKPTVAGSRGGNAALASLLTGLATLGLLTDSTTA